MYETLIVGIMKLSPKLEKYRIQYGLYKTNTGDAHGAFRIRIGDQNLYVISNGHIDPVWEHVSVSARNRCPTWKEMCAIKDLFWAANETVLQFHPSVSEYVNHHNNCLHLWKKCGENHELPPKWMV